MGFSPFGLIVALVMLAPSLALLAWPPRTPMPVGRVPRPLAWLETAGQALCLTTAAVVAPGPPGEMRVGQVGQHEHQELPINIPAANTSAPPTITWNAAASMGVSI